VMTNNHLLSGISHTRMDFGAHTKSESRQGGVYGRHVRVAISRRCQAGNDTAAVGDPCDPRIHLSPKERMPLRKLVRTIQASNNVARTIPAARLM
jgi:hypothetical protein